MTDSLLHGAAMSLYRGGQPEKIRIQNSPNVREIAEWLLDCQDGSRWGLYSRLLREYAKSGGLLYLWTQPQPERWVKSCLGTWQQQGSRMPMAILQTAAAQVKGWDPSVFHVVASPLARLIRESGPLEPAGECLSICKACQRYEIVSASDEMQGRVCPQCDSDTISLKPARVSRDVKEAVSRGILLELVAAIALDRAGGQPFTAPAKPHGPHTVGLTFHHGVHPLEFDVVGELDDALVVFECKDLGIEKTLNINTLDGTAAKIQRFRSAVEKRVQESHAFRVVYVVVTTGTLHDAIPPNELEIAFEGLRCLVIDNRELCKIVSILRPLEPAGYPRGSV